ncbi:exodeoxyribonuclease X C-terminal domain-containing protein [Sulfurimonas sp.]
MLIFVDVELSSFEHDAVICSVGLIGVKDGKITKHYELINEGKKITAEASALHHITNEMIADAPAFKESITYKYIQENCKTLVIHSERAELAKLISLGINVGSMIDTCRVSKHLMQESEIFILQYLRYELRLYKDEQNELKVCGIKDALIAHHALSDALITKLLYAYLLKLANLEQMKDLSFENVLLEKFGFGKYKGKYIEEVAMSDRSYLIWLLSLENLDEDLRYSLEYYLQG